LEEIETLVKDYYRLWGAAQKGYHRMWGVSGGVSGRSCFYAILQSNKKEMHIFMTPVPPHKSSVSGEEYGQEPGRTSSQASTTKSGTAPPPALTLIMDSVESRLTQPP